MRTIVAILTGLAFLAGCSGPEEADYNLADVSGRMAELELGVKDAEGELRTADDFRGRAVLLFFGFTNCPDACPTTLARTRTALAQLPDNLAEQVAVVFVTVDPQRDTRDRLREYVAKFEMPQLIALRTTGQELDALMERYHVHAELQKDGPDDTDYGVNHSSQLFVFGPDGRARLVGRLAGTSGDSPEALAEDLRKIL